ncbi:UbiA prenyltransferase family protein [Streptomyces sp. ST2-7A]|uniref:UbiA prenyltransferase family protein n=1 Tax=Streptomyces sp. ST2-7A TaxID=2907214 RepID=UPI001F3A9BF3|nr:UbiA prenyltransferase family protein [Streptomyces sp. ST2-7A]MCE7079790.1 UbiA prenyltransferase family protein [Streptomyces sp. ST2-7A]
MTTSADQPLDTTLPVKPARLRVPERPVADVPPPGPIYRRRSLPRDLLALVRPGQLPKNLLVVPLALLDAEAAPEGLPVRIAWAILLFTLASSLVYVWNDLRDRDRDRMHPTKCDRPIASGRVGVPTAIAFGGVLALLLAAAALLGPVTAWWPIVAYLCINAAYSSGLKHVPLLDVFLVASGFALRVVQGHLAAGTGIRSWMLVSVFSLCLIFVLGKRRHEMERGGVSHRPALRGYSVQYLDHLIVLCAAVSVTTFLIHLQQAVDTRSADLAVYGSAPFALFAMARYLQLLQVHGDRGGEPTRILLRDRAMLINSLLWALLLGGTLLAHH